MPNVKLTKTVIDSLTYQADKPGVQLYWDTTQPGFGVQLFKSGKKSFVVGYTVAGRFKRYALGPYGELTLQQARDWAKELRVLARKSGKDPIEEQRRRIEEEQRQEIERRKAEEEERDKVEFTVRALAEAYIDPPRGKARRKPIGERAMREYRRIFEKVLYPSALASRPMRDINRDDVILFHESLSDRPRTADYTIQRLRAAFNEARRWGLIPYNSINPFADVPRLNLTERDVWVKHEEIPPLIDSINQCGDPVLRAYFLTLLYTGQRRSETARLKWEDIDFAQRTATFRETKNKETHILPLSELALDVLKSIPRMENSPYVFWSATSKSGHIEEPKAAWAVIRKRAGLDHITLHDLRRTFGCILACEGVPLQHIAQVLNHKDLRSTRIYARLARDVSQRTVDAFAEKIVSIADIRKAAKEAG